MTDHARAPEGVETWTVWVCPAHGVVMPGSPWSVEHDDELIHTPTVPCNRICLEVEVVRLSALLAEREAREQAEATTDLAGRLMDALRERCDKTEADRDAAVARAEQAERNVEKLIGDYRAALDDAKREYDRAEQAEAERDEARKMLELLKPIVRHVAGLVAPEAGFPHGAVSRQVIYDARAALGNDEGTSTTAEAARDAGRESRNRLRGAR